MTQKLFNPKDLQLSSYDFDLPQELIALRPSPKRDESRLLVYDLSTQQITHSVFKELPTFLPQDTLMVMNETKVIPCRLMGERPTGGKCEVFLLSLVPLKSNSSSSKVLYEALIGSSRKKKIGDHFLFAEGRLIATVEAILDNGHFALSFNQENLQSFLEVYGRLPLPPYIRQGEADQQDLQDYQTVFAHHAGSVAAPTAGLHFTPELLDLLDKRGPGTARVTLHVGAGTFTPVKTENILEHQMHEESFFASTENIQKIQKAQGNIVAVGTTTLRVLESCTNELGHFSLSPHQVQKTNIFLYPGKEIRSVRGLLTNFHLPKSTLLMLVSAFVGREKTLALYEEAIRHRYRFFSYGDAMLLIRSKPSNSV